MRLNTLGRPARGALLTAALLTGLLVAATAPRAHADSINTYSSWNGSDYQWPLGYPDTSTYGQTFTVAGPSTVLNSFEFSLGGLIYHAGAVEFAAYVMQWDSIVGEATGPVLYQSAATTDPNTSTAFNNYTINTGSLALTAGDQYVAFFSIDGALYGQSSGATGMGWVGDAYAGGSTVWQNNGGNFGALTASPWVVDADSDMAFDAEFSNPVATPEPAPLVLLATGLLLLGLVARRRQLGAAA